MRLADVRGIRCLDVASETRWNHAYFPIFVEPDYPLSRDDLYQQMRGHRIWVRRYFYPLISEFPMYRGLPSAQRDNLPVASAAAGRVLCLPMYPALRESEVEEICDIINRP
jgi:dTDP-4-amino-4,6-dideoxygalactose transaminase